MASIYYYVNDFIQGSIDINPELLEGRNWLAIAKRINHLIDDVNDAFDDEFQLDVDVYTSDRMKKLFSATLMKDYEPIHTERIKEIY